MKRTSLILLVLALWLGACSRPLPSTPTPTPTEGAMQDQTDHQATPSPVTPTPTQVKVAMITVTPGSTPTPTPAPTPTPIPSPEGIVTGDLVNLRSGPDTGYAIIGEAALSQTVQIIGRDIESEWWQICCPSDEDEFGWISAEFLETTLPLTQTAELVPAIEFPEILNGVVSGGEINLRSGPGTQYELVGEIALGETIEIVGRNKDNNWWQINHPTDKGKIAWIYAKYVLTNFDPADAKRRLPAIEPPPPATPAPTPLITSTIGITLGVSGVITGDTVNLREGPGTEYALVGRVTQSQTVQIVGRNADNSWQLLCCQGDDNAPGWISAEFVLIDDAENLSQIPVITATISGQQTADHRPPSAFSRQPSAFSHQPS